MHRVLVKPKGRASIAVSDDRQAFVNGASGCRLGGSFLHATCRATRRSAACARRIYTGSRRSRRGCKGRARIIERWQRSEGIVSGRSWSAWQGPQPLVGEHDADRVGMGLSCAGWGSGRQHPRLVLPPAVPRAASAPLEASSGVAARKIETVGFIGLTPFGRSTEASWCGFRASAATKSPSFCGSQAQGMRKTGGG